LIFAASLSALDPKDGLASMSGKVYSTGPNGEVPVVASTVTLSEQEILKVKALKATAAIVLHFGGNDWSSAQVSGLKYEFARLGIAVVAVTDANFKPEKQVSDIETVLARKPNIIVSIPTDPVATADAYKRAAEQGTTLVFMDNVPQGLKAGKDYVSVVSSDNFGNGIASAHLMAQAVNGKGDIGIIFHAADFFVTKQRYQGFKKTISESYPGIKIAVEQGIGGPDFAGDGEKAASAMLTKYPNLKAIWAVWDVPAEGVLASARSAGRTDLVVITEDLGLNVAIDMAQKGNIRGLGAQRPFDQGVTEARLAAYGLLKKKAPDYVAWNALPVNRDNLLESWTTVYHQEAPAELSRAYKSAK
jgi:ribose transport system substrate-binding protein